MRWGSSLGAVVELWGQGWGWEDDLKESAWGFERGGIFNRCIF